MAVIAAAAAVTSGLSHTEQGNLAATDHYGRSPYKLRLPLLLAGMLTPNYEELMVMMAQKISIFRVGYCRYVHSIESFLRLF